MQRESSLLPKECTRSKYGRIREKKFSYRKGREGTCFGKSSIVSCAPSCVVAAQHRLTHDRNRGGSTAGEPDEESTGYEGEYIYDDG
jgi:hypothetical protein